MLALVFDRMSAGGRDLAHKAALTYLSARRDGDFVAIFSIDLALHLIQPFTDDTERIKAAIDEAASQAGSSFALGREGPGSSGARAAGADGRADGDDHADGAGPGSTASSPPAIAGGAAAERDIARLQVGMMQSFEALERDQQGFATSNGLLAVVQGLQRIPGRKTIVFFSEGMAIPDRVLAQFQAVIAAANRANVASTRWTPPASGLTARPRRRGRRSARRPARLTRTGRGSELTDAGG